MPIPATFLGRRLTWALLSLQQSDALQDEALLRYYAQEWDRYTTGANYINRLFTYLNRHWVKRERDEGRKGVYPVYTVRLPSFQLGGTQGILRQLHVAILHKGPLSAERHG